MKNLGYYLSIILIFIFLILSSILGFRLNNSIWAVSWMSLIIFSSIITSYLNIKKTGKIIHKIIFMIMNYAFALLLIFTLVYIFSPNLKLYIY